jgi:hypothetical protein
MEIKNLVIPTYLFDGLGIAIKAQSEGLNVFMIRMDNSWAGEKIIDKKNEESWLEIGKGLITIYDPEKGLKELKKLNPQETFILFDFNYGSKTLAPKIKELGFKGLIPTPEDRKFEKDRQFAQEYIKKNYPELKPPEEWEFKNIKDAIDFLNNKENNDLLIVIKPNNPDLSTFIPENKEEAEEFITNNKQQLEKSGFIFQRKIKNGVELTPEVIFDFDGNPISASVDIEYKKLGNYGTSSMTGCSADLVFPIPINSKIIEIGVKPIFQYIKQRALSNEPALFWDAAIMYDLDNGMPYYLESCSNRFGINSFYTEISIAGSVSNFINRLVNGINPLIGQQEDFNWELDTPFGASIRLFNMFFGDKKEELVIPTENNFLSSNIWLMDAKKENNKIKTTKFSEDAIILTHSSYSPIESLSIVQNMALDNKWNLFYKRTDLTFRGFNESILDRYEYGEDNGLFEEIIKIN